MYVTNVCGFLRMVNVRLELAIVILHFECVRSLGIIDVVRIETSVNSRFHECTKYDTSFILSMKLKIVYVDRRWTLNEFPEIFRKNHIFSAFTFAINHLFLAGKKYSNNYVKSHFNFIKSLPTLLSIYTLST